MKVDGRCHCGLITYVAEVDPDKVELCHCTDCQIMSGSAFRIVVPAEPGTFKLQSGKLKTYVKTAESGNRRVQAFCPECGTSIYSTAAAEGPQTIGLRVGAIVQRSQLPPKIQYWTRSRQHWVTGIAALRSVEKE
jgi:hypothetical protein